jgi:hypothetical protein
MTTAEILRAARALYAASPSHAPAHEYPCDGECPITALTKVMLEDDHLWPQNIEAERALARAADTDGIPEWNETASTAEVLAAFDRAIAAAEAGS